MCCFDQQLFASKRKFIPSKLNEKKIYQGKKGNFKHLIVYLCPLEFPLWLSELRTRPESIRMWIQFLALLSGLKIWRYHELWCRSQTWLGSREVMAVAVEQSGSYRSGSTPSLGTSILHGEALKRQKKKKRFICVPKCPGPWAVGIGCKFYCRYSVGIIHTPRP